MPPTGGDKDTLSPYILYSVPLPLSKNFKGKGVVLVFNEWIKEKEINKELLITPKINYKHRIKKNQLFIDFLEPLKPNTTYSLNFRQGIGDLNEGNTAIADTVSKQLPRLAFSTGDILDTLFIKGNVKMLKSGQPPKEAIISLYLENDTLDIETDEPQYFTLADKSGNFTFTNLKAGKYKLFAWEETNKNSTYQEGEPLGFWSETIDLPKDEQKEFNLFLAIEDHKAPEISKEYMLDGRYEIEFREGLQSISLESDTKIQYVLNDKMVRIYPKNYSNDSISIKMIAIDSSENQLKTDKKFVITAPKKKNKKEEKKRFEIKPELMSGSGIEKNLELMLISDKPIEYFDPKKIKFYVDKDTAKIQPLLEQEGKDWKWNEYKSAIQINKEIKFKEKIEILADSALFITIEKDSSNAFKKTYSLKQVTQFASISGTVETQTPNFIIELVNDKEEIVASKRNVKKFIFEYLPAGTYRFRVIIDKNNNGKWDASNWKKNLPFEPIIQILIEQNKGKIKEKWDLEGIILKF
jgi:uncharacterized protein (DUF2141 family)